MFYLAKKRTIDKLVVLAHCEIPELKHQIWNKRFVNQLEMFKDLFLFMWQCLC